MKCDDKCATCITTSNNCTKCAIGYYEKNGDCLKCSIICKTC